eukprot:TRINITY_DN16210_c0_g1_i1.p1 TRINITY_DN16210_c0_g1~~TRINITY_DN16210_c0_g1_i1.p1  ORF type:complete len:144 (+),score=17.40 TRINITY_DN16210_c0_g1_i1:143-574(+)
MPPIDEPKNDTLPVPVGQTAPSDRNYPEEDPGVRTSSLAAALGFAVLVSTLISVAVMLVFALVLYRKIKPLLSWRARAAARNAGEYHQLPDVDHGEAPSSHDLLLEFSEAGSANIGMSGSKESNSSEGDITSQQAPASSATPS